MSMKNINMGPKIEDRPKESVDVACEVKQVSSYKSSYNLSNSRLTCESTLMATWEDTNVKAIKKNTKVEVNDAEKTPILKDDNVSSHITNIYVIDGELLRVLMSLYLDHFTNGVLNQEGYIRKTFYWRKINAMLMERTII